MKREGSGCKRMVSLFIRATSLIFNLGCSRSLGRETFGERRHAGVFFACLQLLHPAGEESRNNVIGVLIKSFAATHPVRTPDRKSFHVVLSSFSSSSSSLASSFTSSSSSFTSFPVIQSKDEVKGWRKEKGTRRVRERERKKERETEDQRADSA